MSGAAAQSKPLIAFFEMSAASIDALKWLTVVIDYINKFVFKEAVPSLVALGQGGHAIIWWARLM